MTTGHALPRYRPLPPPSPLALSGAPFPDAPPAPAVRAVLGVRRFLTRLADRLCPAEIAIFDHARGLVSTMLVGTAARFGFADLLEQRGSANAQAIAEARGLNADAVHRCLRALSALGVFTMDERGEFANNRRSRVLLSGQPTRTREWALYFSSGSNVAAWADLPRTIETGESAFRRVHGVSVWEWFDAHPDEREMFAHCMMGITVRDAPLVASLYPFAEVNRLCDVGGGRGTLLSEILLRHGNVQGVLYDAPGVIQSARDLLQKRGLSARVELAPGSFFDAVPEGCDAYLMKNILHDWDDATCKRLLANVRRAARPGARIILVEQLVEQNSQDPIATFVDLQMMIACDEGRERSLEELKTLLAEAGFRYRRVFTSPTLGVIEGEAV